MSFYQKKKKILGAKHFRSKKVTWNNLKSTIVKCVIITDKLDNAGSIMAISNAFVCVFNGKTRPDTL